MAKKLTEEQVLSLVEVEFNNSIGGHGGDLANERARAWDYYNRKPFGNEEAANSKVVTSDVSDVIDSIMPPLVRMFTTQDNLLTYDPVGPEDEAAAQQESDIVQHQFFKRNSYFEIIFFWMFDALLQKNGYVKCHWDESEEVETESYEGLTEDELIGLLSDEELEPIEREERIEIFQHPETGEPVEVTVTDVKFNRVTKRGFAHVENVPPEEFRISADANRLDPAQARMTGHERYVTRGELIEMGFDKKIVDSLPSEAVSISAEDLQARKDKTDDHKISSSGGSDDKSQDNILLREAYLRCDMDGDGRAELKQIFTADGRMLEINDIDRQPFHCLCPSPLPHKHIGLATADKVMDSQFITSTLLRQVLDNLYHTNNPGSKVWEQALGDDTMDSLLTRKIGAVTTFTRPVNEAHATLDVPFTAGASFPMLEYFDKVKRDRTGVQADSESLKPDALKHIQQSVMMQSLDTGKAKIEMIARIFAETGFKTLFLHMHELMQKHQNKQEVIKLRGTWVPVDPQGWRTRRDMTVHIGLGIGSREQNLLHLDAIWQKQREMIEGGGMGLTVTPKTLYNTAAEIVKNANYKEPAMFFQDPGDKPAPPPSDQQIELQKKEQAIQEEKNKLNAERNQLNQAKVQLQAQEQQVKAQIEMMKLQEKAEEREDKMAAANEKLRNELLEMQMKFSSTSQDRELLERKNIAEIEEIQAKAMKSRAETARIIGEAEGLEIENAAVESGLSEVMESITKSAEAEK